MFAEGSVVDYPLTIRRRDGALTDVLYNATVYRDASGNVLGVFAAARDVTERKRAERLLRARERQQQAVAELGYLALSNPGLGALLDAAVLAVARALEVEFAKVLELRSDGDLLLRAEIGFDAGLVGHAVVPGGTGVSGWLCAARGRAGDRRGPQRRDPFSAGRVARPITGCAAASASRSGRASAHSG